MPYKWESTISGTYKFPVSCGHNHLTYSGTASGTSLETDAGDRAQVMYDREDKRLWLWVGGEYRHSLRATVNQSVDSCDGQGTKYSTYQEEQYPVSNLNGFGGQQNPLATSLSWDGANPTVTGTSQRDSWWAVNGIKDTFNLVRLVPLTLTPSYAYNTTTGGLSGRDAVRVTGASGLLWQVSKVCMDSIWKVTTGTRTLSVGVVWNGTAAAGLHVVTPDPDDEVIAIDRSTDLGEAYKGNYWEQITIRNCRPGLVEDYALQLLPAAANGIASIEHSVRAVAYDHTGDETYHFGPVETPMANIQGGGTNYKSQQI
jgi:hypothetical protein